jgi:hypothetical protein
VTVTVTVLVAVLVGCTGDQNGSADGGATGDSSSAGVKSHVGMRATVVQQRTDVGTTRIGLEVTTDHHTTVHVTGVQLLSAAFEARALTTKDTNFSPDRTIDLTVDYGTPICASDVSVDDAQVLVRFVREGSDAEETATLPVAKLGRDMLANLHDGGCARQEFDRAVSVSYNLPFRRRVVNGDLSLVGNLRMQRPADGGSGDQVLVESVFGSVLFVFEGHDGTGSAPLQVLKQGRQSARVPVVIRGNNRCDPHERSASQQTFVFTIDVRVGDSKVHREIIEPPTPLRVQAMALLDDVC